MKWGKEAARAAEAKTKAPAADDKKLRRKKLSEKNEGKYNGKTWSEIVASIVCATKVKSYLVQCQSGVGATTKHKMCVRFFLQVESDRLTTCITLIVLIVVSGQCAYALHCTAHSLEQAQVEVEMITILMLRQQLTTMMMKCGYNFVIVAVPLFRFVSIRLARLLWHLALIWYLLLVLPLTLLLLVLFSIHKSFTFIGISVCQPFLFLSRIECGYFLYVAPIHFSPRNGFSCDCYYYLFHSVVALRNLLRSVIGFNFLGKFNLLLFDCCFVLFSSCLHTYRRSDHTDSVSHSTRWIKKTPTMRMWACTCTQINLLI